MIRGSRSAGIRPENSGGEEGDSTPLAGRVPTGRSHVGTEDVRLPGRTGSAAPATSGPLDISTSTSHRRHISRRSPARSPAPRQADSSGRNGPLAYLSSMSDCRDAALDNLFPHTRNLQRPLPAAEAPQSGHRRAAGPRMLIDFCRGPRIPATCVILIPAIFPAVLDAPLVASNSDSCPGTLALSQRRSEGEGIEA